MTFSNGQVKTVLDGLNELCGRVNRLPVLTALSATRTLKAFSTAWEPCEAVRVQLIEEHGQKDKKTKKVTGVKPNTPGMTRFLEAWTKLLSEEQDVTFEPLDMGDIEQGFARDPETGQKGPLEISPMGLLALVDLGIIDDGEAKPKKKPALKKKARK